MPSPWSLQGIRGRVGTQPSGEVSEDHAPVILARRIEDGENLQVTSAMSPQKIRAWVTWEGGVEELVVGLAAAWAKRAVRVRFGIPGHMHDVWVWAGAVDRV